MGEVEYPALYLNLSGVINHDSFLGGSLPKFFDQSGTFSFLLHFLHPCLRARDFSGYHPPDLAISGGVDLRPHAEILILLGT